MNVKRPSDTRTDTCIKWPVVVYPRTLFLIIILGFIGIGYLSFAPSASLRLVHGQVVS